MGRKNRYFRILNRSQRQINRELDLVRFLKIQQMQWLAVLTSLDSTQLQLIDRLSMRLVHESSDVDQASDENELSGERAIWKGQPVERRHLTKLFKSKTPLDRRLVTMIKLQGGHLPDQTVYKSMTEDKKVMPSFEAAV